MGGGVVGGTHSIDQDPCPGSLAKSIISSPSNRRRIAHAESFQRDMPGFSNVDRVDGQALAVSGGCQYPLLVQGQHRNAAGPQLSPRRIHIANICKPGATCSFTRFVERNQFAVGGDVTARDQSSSDTSGWRTHPGHDKSFGPELRTCGDRHATVPRYVLKYELGHLAGDQALPSRERYRAELVASPAGGAGKPDLIALRLPAEPWICWNATAKGAFWPFLSTTATEPSELVVGCSRKAMWLPSGEKSRSPRKPADDPWYSSWPGGNSICQPLVVSTITARSAPSAVQSAKPTSFHMGRGSPRKRAPERVCLDCRR